MMRKFLFGFLIAGSVLFISCGKSYTIGLMFVDDKDLAATMIGPSEIEDALVRIRKDIKDNHESTAPVPKWIVRKVPKILCTSEENKTIELRKKDEKKLRRSVRSFPRRVNVVFDYTCEKALRVLAPLYVHHNLAVVSPYGNSYSQSLKTSESEHNATHVFSTALSPDTEIYTILDFLARQGIQNISVIDDGLRYSRVNANMLVHASKNFDIRVVFRGQVLPHGSDVKSLVTRMSGKNNDDALVYIGSPASAAQCVKQLRIMGYTNPLVLSSIAGGNAFLSRVGSYTDELYFVRKHSIADSTSFRTFSAWFENRYAPLYGTRAVEETYVALEIAQFFAQNKTRVPNATHAINTERGTMTNERIPTLFGNVYFDAQNAIRGVYGIFAVKDGLFIRYDENKK